MTAPNKMAKRAAAGTLALAVCFTGGVLGASAAQAAPGFAFDQRLGGADRFETAVNASRAAFADGAGDVIVVQDNALADGLTASYLAGVREAPILYVRQNEVPTATAAELTRLNAERIYIVGGTSVVSTGVESALRSNGRTVTRVSGSDRYETAARVATSNGNDVGTVFIANGDAPADALAAGPIAYRSNNPILLTRSDSVPASTTAALNQLNEENRIVLGGNAVVSTSTYADLDANNRLRGVDRQGTAVAIADYATANEGFTKANAALVGSEDRNTADALIAAPLLGQTGTPILFTTRNGLGTTSRDYLVANVGALTGEGYIFGGSAAVPQSVIDEATAAASGEATPQPPTSGGITVSPTDAIVLESVSVADETPDPDISDDRVYTVTGLDQNAQYRVTLVASENITEDGGVVSFREDGESGLALAAAQDDNGANIPVRADITAVNGTPTSSEPTQGGLTPVDGGLTFRVDGDGFETVTPVVYVDGGDNTRLEIDDNGTPTESYALGGTIFYQPEQAENGGATFGEIYEVSKDSDYLIAGPSTTNPRLFNYDANDTFFLISPDGGSAEELDIEEFEARLTIGDSLAEGTDYRDNPALSSTFFLINTEPRQLTISDTDATDSSVTLTIDDDDINDGATVEVFYTEDGSADPAEERDARDFQSVTATEDEDEDTTGFQITVGNLQADNPYFFFARQVLAGEEGEFSDQVPDSTLEEGENAALESLSASVVDDNGLQGEVDETDVYQIGFNQPLDTINAGDIIRVVDEDGESLNLVNGGSDGNATFTLNATAQRFDGETYAPNELLTVGVNSVPETLTDRDGNADNNNESLDYPLTITTQAGITAQVDEETESWTPVGDTDNVLELGGQPSEDVPAGPVAPDTTSPFITTAVLTADAATADNSWSAVGDAITVTFSEPVTGATGVITESVLEAILGTQVAYDADPATVVTATGTGATRIFTISGGALIEGINVGDAVDGTANANVRDLATTPNNQIANPDASPTLTDGV